ncbi:MAG: M23 family metallopeptidase [Rubrivivax sp.]|nr:M23 family metallopeptidase [Rubrivivax sp.]
MQFLITHGSMARTRALRLQRWQLVLGALGLAALLMATSGAVYHFVFLKAAREGWPLVSPLVRLMVRDEVATRERFMRNNLDAMAQRVGEMQAKLVKLEAMGERVSGLAGMKADELKPLQRAGVITAPTAPPPSSTAAGRGGPYVPAVTPSLEQLQALVSGLDEAADVHTDLFTYFESRLQESLLNALLIPSARPVVGPVGSGFGFRADPFNGRAALHTGLDFPAESGTPILAAAGGIVVANEWHAAYGHLLEIDHGNGLVTRYAHCSSIDVSLGALVKRGQVVAKVGSSGRSTGAHLHFEVLVHGVPQDPARFLAGNAPPRSEAAARQTRQ